MLRKGNELEPMSNGNLSQVFSLENNYFNLPLISCLKLFLSRHQFATNTNSTFSRNRKRVLFYVDSIGFLK